MSRWLLPEGIADVLPHEAMHIERLRRALLDLYRCHGYEQVIPPLVEYLDSLLTGTGRDLDLRTFKLVDQLSGRQLGLRADITPQTARIDAHILNRAGVVRLCYAGAVLHTRPAHPLASREPLQVGAELYGFAGLQADAEIQSLAVQSLRMAGQATVQVDLGHTGITRALLAADPVAAARACIESGSYAEPAEQTDSVGSVFSVSSRPPPARDAVCRAGRRVKWGRCPALSRQSGPRPCPDDPCKRVHEPARRPAVAMAPCVRNE